MEKRVPKDSISVVPSTPVVTVNADPMNTLEYSDENNFQDKKVDRLLKKGTILYFKIMKSSLILF